jgi:tetratricopeptide (TPR) repeat protein
MMQAISLLLIAGLAAAQSDALIRGIEAFKKGDYAAAERELRPVSGDPRAQAFLGMTLAATSRCAEAEAMLKQAHGGADAEIARLAGQALVQCHLAGGRTNEAAGVVNRLAERFPDDADVLYQKARLHMRAWNDTVYQLYQKAPASFRVNQLSGEILEIQGQFAEAAAEYRKALEKSPNTPNLHFRLGRALLMSSHAPETLEAALKEFEAELALNPSDAIAHYQVAQILQVQQKAGPATARFEKALELKPDFTEVLIALGKLRLDAKRNEEAVSLLERAVKLAPGSETAHYNLMMAYRNAGRMDDARRQKAELDKLQKTPEGEFSEFLKRLGEKAPVK